MSHKVSSLDMSINTGVYCLFCSSSLIFILILYYLFVLNVKDGELIKEYPAFKFFQRSS